MSWGVAGILTTLLEPTESNSSPGIVWKLFRQSTHNINNDPKKRLKSEK
jgi:hypothetical protein